MNIYIKIKYAVWYYIVYYESVKILRPPWLLRAQQHITNSCKSRLLGWVLIVTHYFILSIYMLVTKNIFDPQTLRLEGPLIYRTMGAII